MNSIEKTVNSKRLAAQSRWKILQSVILSSSDTQNKNNKPNLIQSKSKRKHQGFNLFSRQKRDVINNNLQLEEWFAYDLYDHVTLNVR
jgi:hypothetical protein